MHEIRILALTEVGKEAIQKHLSEGFKTPRVQKLLFNKLGWNQKVVQLEPLLVTFELSKKEYQELIKYDDMKALFERIMREKGAGPNDYQITGE